MQFLWVQKVVSSLVTAQLNHHKLPTPSIQRRTVCVKPAVAPRGIISLSRSANSTPCHLQPLRNSLLVYVLFRSWKPGSGGKSRRAAGHSSWPRSTQKLRASDRARLPSPCKYLRKRYRCDWMCDIANKQAECNRSTQLRLVTLMTLVSLITLITLTTLKTLITLIMLIDPILWEPQ